jgi:hypothetical protein
LKEGKNIKEKERNNQEENDRNVQEIEKLAEKSEKLEKDKTKLDVLQKTSLFISTFDEVVNTLEEELRIAFPESFWVELTSRYLLKN